MYVCGGGDDRVVYDRPLTMWPRRDNSLFSQGAGDRERVLKNWGDFFFE